MSRDDRLAQLLQECVAAYETGLSPEECLSAFAADRTALEPLFRQALSLRFAFASAPAEEFIRRTKERLLFAAGHEVSAAFALEPAPEFTARARHKLVQTAGATAREALRAVPPPRLPFWVNARRRLLEAAALGARPAVRPMALALRAGFSAAVVVLAIAATGLAYVVLQSGTPAIADELDILIEETNVVQQKLDAGEDVAVTVIVNLTERTNDLVQKLGDDVSPPDSEKLQDLIQQQEEIVEQVSGDEPAPELAEAKQNLDEASEKVTALALADSSPTATPEASAEPSAAVAGSPAATTPQPAPTTFVLLADQIYFSAEPGDATAGLTWRRAKTLGVSFVLPGSWKASGLAINLDGVLPYDVDTLRVDGPDGEADVTLLINLKNGAITALSGGEQIRARRGGVLGEIISQAELTTKLGSAGAVVYHIAASMEVALPPTPTPEPAPTETPATP